MFHLLIISLKKYQSQCKNGIIYLKKIDKMGNLCADDMYKQVKEKYPQDFQKFVEMKEIEKQIQTKTQELQTKTKESAENIKKENLSTFDTQSAQLKNHFRALTEDVQQSYPGGVSFLESSKQVKLEELIGYSEASNKIKDMKTNYIAQFDKQQEKVNQEIKTLQQGELNQVKAGTPNLQLFNQMTESAKQSIYNSGLKQYQSQIEAKTKEYLSRFDQKFSGENFTDRFKNLLPLDRLQSLTQIAKGQMTKKATTFIGEPGEGKATLF